MSLIWSVDHLRLRAFCGQALACPLIELQFLLLLLVVNNQLVSFLF
jgi:hypothetical protein